VKGMTCSACEELVKESILDEGAMKVFVSYRAGEVIVEHNDSLSTSKIKSIISNEGYEVV
jgi:copper chaperone CopZ